MYNIFQNIDRRRQKVGYNAYTDDLTEMESALDNKVLSKYDEEIEGEKRSNFTIGERLNHREGCKVLTSC